MARKKIYDSDATVVYAEPAKEMPTEDKVIVAEDIQVVAEPKRIKVSDIVSAFAGYTIPQINPMSMGEGMCVICGAETNSEIRTICFDCMKKYKNTLLKEAMEFCGNSEINI